MASGKDSHILKLGSVIIEILWRGFTGSIYYPVCAVQLDSPSEAGRWLDLFGRASISEVSYNAE